MSKTQTDFLTARLGHPKSRKSSLGAPKPAHPASPFAPAPPSQPGAPRGTFLGHAACEQPNSQIEHLAKNRQNSFSTLPTNFQHQSKINQQFLGMYLKSTHVCHGEFRNVVRRMARIASPTRRLWWLPGAASRARMKGSEETRIEKRQSQV